MKQRVLFLIIIATTGLPIHLLPSAPSTCPNQWPYRSFAYVNAYLYNPGNSLHGGHGIIKNNRLDKTVVGDGIRLTDTQVDTILSISNKKIGGLIEGLSKSYIPHHALVFYDKNNSPIAYITFCFDCEAVRVFPELPFKRSTIELSDQKIKALLQLLEQYKTVILETGLPVFDTPFQYREYGKNK
ncbi:MAG: hypothetical protein GY765_06745 [bacterium]|nr:hypothetical protein [bacterium]